MSVTEQEIRDEEIIAFLDIIKVHSIYDFTDYALKSLKRRIAKILSENKLTIDQLGKEILINPKFMEQVVMSITVNTTELFRDPAIWKNIRDNILPNFEQNNKITIWHAGCSTGQEVYSMMMILEEMELLSKSEIYASDINSGVLETAKTGKYKYLFNQSYIDNFNLVMSGTEDLSPDQPNTLQPKYFSIDKVSDSIQMKSSLTDKPEYKKIDLVKDEDLFSIKFDLIICRNVIIYFNYKLQNKIFKLFYENLLNDGCLLLGLHESIIGPYANQFERKHQAYFKKKNSNFNTLN